MLITKQNKFCPAPGCGLAPYQSLGPVSGAGSIAFLRWITTVLVVAVVVVVFFSFSIVSVSTNWMKAAQVLQVLTAN